MGKYLEGKAYEEQLVKHSHLSPNNLTIDC